MQTTVEEVARLVDGHILQGPSDRVLRALGALGEGGVETLSFFGNARYEEDFRTSAAGAILVRSDQGNGPEGSALIQVENPIVAFDIVVRKFGAPEIPFEPGIHPTAVIDPSVRFETGKIRVEPYAVIDADCELGDGCWIGPHVSISRGVRLGNDCRIYSHVSIREGSVLGHRVILHAAAVIGSDGYGYEFQNGRHEKIRQAGIVEIGDDVEIGSSTTVDRARFGATVIGEGTKIDNQVQVGHNVKIGRHCIIVAQVGISGSATIGDYVTVAAQSGIAGHIRIGDRAILGGRTGAIADLPGGETYFGYPAKPMKEWSRHQMFAKKLPRLHERVRELEKRASPETE